MAYHESRKTVIEAMATYLKEAIAKQGLDPKALVTQHSEINLGAPDLYSKALLYKGVVAKDAPVFANVPQLDFSWIIGNHLEEIFCDLGLPRTQGSVATFETKLRHTTIDRLINVEVLENTRVIKNKFVKVKAWFEEALGIINQMRLNTPLLQTVTAKEKEFSKLLNFDWYYGYIDDSSMYNAGLQRHKETVAKINTVLAGDPDLICVVKAVSAAHRLGPTFFTQA